MPRLSASIWVAAPPEIVFAVIEEPGAPLLPHGGPKLTRVGLAVGTGALYRWEYHRLGVRLRADSVVIDYRPAERLLFRGTAGWEMEADVTLHPEQGGTRLRFHMRYRFPRPLSWVIPGPLIRLGVWHAMRQVKMISEERVKQRRFQTPS